MSVTTGASAGSWLTNTGVSSARLYWENKQGFFDIKGVSVPAAVSVFPRELYQAPGVGRRAPTPTSSTSTRSTEAITFAAWQEPDLFANEVRAGFRSLR
jgi:hypothetical protein